MTTTGEVMQDAKPADAADPWMSLHQAAKVLGVTRYTLLKRIARGDIRTQEAAGLLFVRREDVDRMKARRAEGAE